MRKDLVPAACLLTALLAPSALATSLHVSDDADVAVDGRVLATTALPATEPRRERLLTALARREECWRDALAEAARRGPAFRSKGPDRRVRAVLVVC